MTDMFGKHKIKITTPEEEKRIKHLPIHYAVEEGCGDKGVEALFRRDKLTGKFYFIRMRNL